MNMMRFKVDPRKLAKKQFNTPGEGSEEEDVGDKAKKPSVTERSLTLPEDVENQNEPNLSKSQEKMNTLRSELSGLSTNE